MMKLIKLMMFGLLIFAIAAGGSWFAMSKQHALTEHADGDGAHNVAVDDDSHADGGHGAAATPAAHGEEEILPVVVRPKMQTAEDIIRNAMSLKEREQKLKQRERAAEQEQLRLAARPVRFAGRTDVD